jgi:DNA-binding PadR family transcriptional regulator
MLRHVGRRPVERITVGDVTAQARTMTACMQLILELVEEGTHDHGRAIGREVGIPYPQAYRTLNVLHARGFIEPKTGEWGATGRVKSYTLTLAGVELLQKVRTASESSPWEGHSRKVDPENYAVRMRLGPVFRWLQGHGVVDSVPELEHIMKCDECNGLLKEHGFTGDVRCETAAQKVNDKEWS